MVWNSRWIEAFVRPPRHNRRWLRSFHAAVAILHHAPETAWHGCSATDENCNVVVKSTFAHSTFVGGLARPTRCGQPTIRVQQNSSSKENNWKEC
jgi:hypothetical protein